MNWDTDSMHRLIRRHDSATAELAQNEKKLGITAKPTLDSKSVHLLEAENAELRHRAAELTLEIQALRED